MSNVDDGEELDLGVSEAFSTLEQYRVQEIDYVAGAAVPEPIPLRAAPQRRWQQRTLVLVGAAAASVVGVVLAVSLLGDGSEPLVVGEASGDAGTVADDPVVPDADEPARSTTTAPAVAVPESSPTSAAPRTTTTTQYLRSTLPPDPPETVAAVEPTPPATAPDVSTTVPQSEGQADTAPPVTTIPEDASSPETTEAAPPPAEEPPPADTIAPEPQATVSGVVSEILRDCHSHMRVGPDGTPVEAGPVLCDGGSYIVINNVRIVTSGGMTLTGQSFNKHPVDLQVGDTASFTTLIDPETGWHTLDCEGCGPTA